jgi:O-antigen/teichoic acid export membrane protein
MTDETRRTTEIVPAAELQRRAVSGSIWTTIHAVVSLPLSFVANAIVARSLGVVSFGHLALLSASLGLAVAFANFGFSSSLIQRGSRAEAAGRRYEADDLLRRSLGFHALVELPILLVVALALTRERPWWEAAAVGTAVLLSCLLGGAALSITIENRTAAAARVAIVLNLALQAASITTALSTGSASAVWAVRTLVPALGLGFGFLLLEPERRRAALRLRLPRGLGRRFWRYAVTTWASGLVGLLVFSRSEIFLLQALHRPQALGLFALAYGLSQQITAPIDAMLHALMPAVAGVLSSWPERAAEAFERATRVSALLAGGIAAVVVPTLVFVVPFVYGADFESAAWLFVPLALASAFQSAANPVIAFVNARERGGLLLRVNVVALSVNIGVALALIPPFGAWGAAAANASAMLVALGWLAATEPFAVNRGLSLLYRPVIVGAATGGAALAVGALVHRWSTAAAPVVACTLGVAAFAMLVRRTRCGLARQDRDALLAVVGVRARPYFSRLLQPLTTGAGP